MYALIDVSSAFDDYVIESSVAYHISVQVSGYLNFRNQNYVRSHFLFLEKICCKFSLPNEHTTIQELFSLIGHQVCFQSPS